MPKKVTTIVYQVPEALPDVYRWAADNKFHLEHGSYGPHQYEVDRPDEFINIIPMCNLPDVPPCTKLVLWGAFSIDDLSTLQEYMQRED